MYTRSVVGHFTVFWPPFADREACETIYAHTKALLYEYTAPLGPER